VQGGETANQVLDFLDYELISANPKLFIGLSDNTVLLNGIYKKTGLVTIHGTDAKVGDEDEYFDSKYSQKEFVSRLMIGGLEVKPNSKWKCVRKGKAKGKLLGGNIRCLLKIAGTGYWPEIHKSILLLEGHYLEIKAQYQITQLKQMGVFEKIAGVAVGYVYGFDMKKQYGKNGVRVFFEDMLVNLTSEYDFSILKIYEVGHKCPSTFLPIGSKAEMDAGKKEFQLTEKFVED
jgi:muramoyltetrapeptide carboxypeptidase